MASKKIILLIGLIYLGILGTLLPLASEVNNEEAQNTLTLNHEPIFSHKSDLSLTANTLTWEFMPSPLVTFRLEGKYGLNKDAVFRNGTNQLVREDCYGIFRTAFYF